MDTDQSSRIETFRKVLNNARDGVLPFEAMGELLEMLVDAGNYPVAAILYNVWHGGLKGDIRLSGGEYERAAAAWTRLRDHVDDLAPLPEPVEWLRINLKGNDLEYRDIDDRFFMTAIERIRSHTITLNEGVEPAWALYKSIEYLVKNRIPGDVVECGVWNGGSVLLAAMALDHFGDRSRKIYLYDTFEGMPQPQDVDRSWDGTSAILMREAKLREPESKVWGFGGTVEMVREVVHSSGYPEENFVFVKGMVEDTLPAQCPDSVAMLRLDTDFYSSTYHELQHLYPRLSTGGVLIIDDYGEFQGARIATDQYIGENRLPLFLSRISRGVRLAIKPSPGLGAG